MNSNNQEIEIKIRLADKKALVAKLEGLGAKKLSNFLSHDVMYDDGKGFFDDQKTLRLRTYDDGRDPLLTYKELMSDRAHAHLLERTEIQTPVKSGQAAHEILGKLGFKPHVIKEKRQENYELEGLEVEVHELPFIGDFIEIEGEEERLRKLLPKLGFAMEDGINKDYSSLFEEYCQSRGLDFLKTPQTFDEEAKHLQKT